MGNAPEPVSFQDSAPSKMVHSTAPVGFCWKNPQNPWPNWMKRWKDGNMVLTGSEGTTKDWNPNRFVCVTEFWWHFINWVDQDVYCILDKLIHTNSWLKTKATNSMFWNQTSSSKPILTWDRQTSVWISQQTLPEDPNLGYSSNHWILRVWKHHWNHWKSSMIWQIGNSHSHVESWCGFVWKC